MAKAKQVDCLEHLLLLLEQIREAGGYFTDAGSRVHWGLLDHGEVDLTSGPVLSLLDPSDESEPVDGQKSLVTVRVEVHGFTQGENLVHSVHELLADIKRAVLGPPAVEALAQPPYRKIKFTGSNRTYPRKDEGGIVRLVARFEMQFIENTGKP